MVRRYSEMYMTRALTNWQLNRTQVTGDEAGRMRAEFNELQLETDEWKTHEKYENV